MRILGAAAPPIFWTLEPPVATPARPLQVAAVLNPIRADDAVWRDVQRACAAAGWPPPTLHTTTVAEPGRTQARRAVAEGAELVLAIGGDGTVRQVAAGLADSGVLLGIVPAGTANLFAHNLGLPRRDLRRAVRIALHGARVSVDLGTARLDDRPGYEPFATMAGIGHDAATIAATGALAKKHLGWLSYLYAGARELLTRPVPMRVRYDDRAPQEVEVWSLLVGNCGRLPAGVAVFPEALLDDGLLESMQVQVHHPVQWLAVAGQGFGHRPVPGSGLVLGRAAEVSVEVDHPQPVQLDGDLYAPARRVRFGVRPGALTVLVEQPRSGWASPVPSGTTQGRGPGDPGTTPA